MNALDRAKRRQPDGRSSWVAPLFMRVTTLTALACALPACTETGQEPETAPAVARVEVSPTESAIRVAQTVQLSATTWDAFGNQLDGRTVSWSSSQQSVATVSSNGRVTGVSAGTATISATSEGVVGISVARVSARVAAVDVEPQQVSIYVGETSRLSATPRDPNGNALVDRTVSWTSGNDAVASVDGTGLVTGIGEGPADIIATSEGVTGMAEIVVRPAVGSLRVSVSTEGVGIDPDGYTVVVDDAVFEAVAVHGTVTFHELDRGEHSVELTGANPNCPVIGDNPLTVTVEVDATVEWASTWRVATRRTYSIAGPAACQ